MCMKILIDCNPDNMVHIVKNFNLKFHNSNIFSNGTASKFIVNQLLDLKKTNIIYE